MHQKLFSALTSHKGTAALDGGLKISFDTLNSDLKVRISKLSHDLCDGTNLVILLADNSYETLLNYLSLINLKIKFILLESQSDTEEVLSPFVKELCSTYRISFVLRKEALYSADKTDDVNGSLQNTYIYHQEIDDNIALLLTTSGSVGNSKLVKITYKNLYENARSIKEYLELTENDRAITSLPFNYSYGLSVINSLLMSGGSLCFTNATMMQKEFWDLMELDITHLAGVPFSYAMLERLRFRRKMEKYPSLRLLTQAGGHLDPAIVKEFALSADALGKRFYVMYGQTEATARMSYLPYNLAAEHPDSIGIAIPRGKFFILKEDGSLTDSINTEGEIVYSGPNVMAGYAQCLDDLKALDTPEYLKTGDLGYFDDNGLLYISGRKKRIIKITGHRLSLDSIEKDLKEKGCDTVAVGQDELLVILLKSGEELLVEEYINNVIKIYKSYVIKKVDDYLYTSNGKIDYKSLSKMYAASK